MSLYPMPAGTPAVLHDGAKVDHLSENTTNHGVRVKGVADPASYPVLTGDVGEVIRADSGNMGIVTNTSGNTTICTLTLTAGVWLVSVAAQHGGGVSCTGSTFRLFVKGVVAYGGKYGADTLNVFGLPSAAQASATFPTQVVVINPGDAIKTVHVTAQSVGAAGTADAAIFATRIA
jgi:hypothetical protein